MRRLLFVLLAALLLRASADAQSTKQINQLPVASSVNANDVAPLQQIDGVTRQATIAQITAYYQTIGVYASTIQPITVAEGVFGGSVSYTFKPVAGYPSLIIQGNGVGGNCCLEFSDTTNTTYTPTKYIRANGQTGALEVVNAASNAVLFSIYDTGGPAGFNAGTIEPLGNLFLPPNHIVSYNGTTGTGISATSGAGNVLCTAYDIYTQVSPYTTYQCNDTNGDLGIPGYFSSGTGSTGQFNVNYQSGAAPSISNSSDGGVNIVSNTSSTLQLRTLTYDGTTFNETSVIAPNASSFFEPLYASDLAGGSVANPVPAPVPPVYESNGTAAAATYHRVADLYCTPSSSNYCTVTLNAQAAFTNYSSVICTVSTISIPNLIGAYPTSNTTIRISSTLSGNSPLGPAYCDGT